MFKEISEISFPSPQNIQINMMPIIFKNEASYPDFIKNYSDIIHKAAFKKDKICYISIHESFIKKGQTQRRPGIHTEATNHYAWGAWGRHKGLYMASNDGACNIWNCETDNVDHHGSLIENPKCSPFQMKRNVLYWLTDKVPHEALPSKANKIRQWFRLVSEDIGVWFEKHNTPNPLGIMPTCPISDQNKFETNKNCKNKPIANLLS